MKYLQKISFGIILISMLSCGQKEKPTIRSDQAGVIEYRVLLFSIKDVKLLDGPFKHATEVNYKYLLNIEPDRLLAKFRIEAGLEPKAKHYGGWEDESLAGHSLGHYLSACALMYQTSDNIVFKQRADYIVDQLEECYKAEGSGYLGAPPGAKKMFEDEVAKGNIRSRGFDLNGYWAPIYTQHKIMAGLLDAYNLLGNEKALELAKHFADWMISYTSQMTNDQMQDMMHCEIGGINDVLAQLYNFTGEQKYLDLSRRFHHEEIIDSLAKGVDILPYKHANTQIPKIIGSSRIYELTGDTIEYNTARFFWDRVVNHHSYITGGHCNHEYFGPPDTLRNRLSNETTETCNIYNMLKLSMHLFEWDAEANVADFYERALFNQILSSQHPETGNVVYNLSLEMGGFKDFQDPMWFTCCIGTGMENHSKYSEAIYYHNNEELFVSQFIASELNWADKGLVIRQVTNFPEQHSSSFEIISDQPQKLSINIRYPYWAANGYEILVNGKTQKIREKPGSFVALNRTWKNGDKVEVKMPFSLRLEAMPDDSNRVGIMYGPLVLAGDLGPVEDENAKDAMYVPVFMTEDRNPNSWLEPFTGGPNTFKTKNIGRPRDVVLKPFYKTYDRRYSVYWDLFTEERWTAQQEEYQRKQAYQKELENKTIDFFQPGEMQPERDHKFICEQGWAGVHNGKKFREADKTWMSFVMKTDPKIKITLVVEYWGAFPGSKTFDILIDEAKIATENISNMNDGFFEYIEYPIPAELTKGKSKVTVKFDPHVGHRAGPIFGVRTIKEE
ncbi:MAG: glycoside hydrolase family 127 protein [Bacteroidales bacterium]|nr:glycoside hydrolase family 127 protein [Bacteroidales bacterium]